jgi:serine/threonine protein kinase
LTKNEFAVKVFDKKRLFTSNYDAKALLRELRILRLINHDSLLKFHEIYESNNHIYIVQEFLKGEKLSDLM